MQRFPKLAQIPVRTRSVRFWQNAQKAFNVSIIPLILAGSAKEMRQLGAAVPLIVKLARLETNATYQYLKPIRGEVIALT